MISLHYLLPFFLFAGFVSISHAQQNSPLIHGVVQDAATGAPLRGVSVEAENALYGSISNNAGEFSLQVSSDHGVMLRFSRPGYADTEMMIAPASGAAVVRLSPEKAKTTEATAAAAPAAVVSEGTLRLNLIRKLIALTTWKDQAARKNSVLTIALIGHNPFGDDLYAFENIELNNRPIMVEFLRSPDEITNQDVLIVSRANATLLQELNAKLEGKTMLVICNDCADNQLVFAALTLFRDGDAIRYSVNKYAPKVMGISLAPVVYELSAQH